MASKLVVLADRQVMGHVHRGSGARLRFVYADSWRDSTDAFPLSLSMPLAAATHGHAVTSAFLWGLLPDNALILDRWAKRHHVSAKDAYALVAAVGEDCPGAVQFVTEERAVSLQDEGGSEVEWLDEAQVAERLRFLSTDVSAWRKPGDVGYFSLAGAQPKTALLRSEGRWGVPSGAMPTTHVLKPSMAELAGHAENEHFCLRLFGAFGLPVARSWVEHYEDVTTIVVARYDRALVDGQWVRVHQEDLCQSLGVQPTRKYEKDGGPSAVTFLETVRSSSTRPEEDLFVARDALMLNWLIGGTDAHAKNHSFLLGRGGDVRLAPLYDVASIYLSERLEDNKLKLAAQIGGEYRLRHVAGRHWRKLAKEAALDAERTLARAKDFAERLPDVASDLLREELASGLDERPLNSLVQSLIERARGCRRLLDQ